MKLSTGSKDNANDKVSHCVECFWVLLFESMVLQIWIYFGSTIDKIKYRQWEHNNSFFIVEWTIIPLGEKRWDWPEPANGLPSPPLAGPRCICLSWNLPPLKGLLVADSRELVFLPQPIPYFDAGGKICPQHLSMARDWFRRSRGGQMFLLLRALHDWRHLDLSALTLLSIGER